MADNETSSTPSGAARPAAADAPRGPQGRPPDRPEYRGPRESRPYTSRPREGDSGGAPRSYGPRRDDRGGSRDSRDDRYSRRRRFQHRKVCAMCVDKMPYIDYKDVALLRRFISERSKIRPARMTGVCAGHQRELTTAIKRARNIALLSYKS